MKNRSRILALIALVTSTFVFSCQKSSKTELSDAQLCLNTATASTAMGCVSKIASSTEPLAYSLRCTAIFVSQGFGDAASFVNALDSINKPATNCSGCSSTINALSALKFANGNLADPNVRTANNQAAADAFAQCSRADAKIYTQIASLFRLGTLTSMLAYAVSGAGYTPTDLANQLPNLSPTDVGALVNITYANTCGNPADAADSSKAYCADLAAAIKPSYTEAAIGSCLLNKLKNTSYVCPP